MAKAQVNYEDDFTVEDETALSRLEERDRADSQGAGISPYAAMAFGANMLPSAGISDVLGYGPDMNVVGGTMPSFSENIESGNYLDAGLQTLGASGDVMLAASPFFPALMVPAAVVKGISSAGKVIKGASKANKVPDDLNLGSGSLFNPEVKKGRKLLIVSCSADKCPDPGDMEAFDRYTGDMYKSIKKVGVPEENVDLAIMSAKYGLIRRDTPIPDYDVKMDKEIAGNLLKDPAQVDRIKNTIDGYDEVVVEGSNLYKGVIKEAAGDAPLRDFKIDFKKAVELGEVKPDGGYGSGRQKQSVGNFLRSNTPVEVYHYTQADVPPNIFDLNKANPYDPISNLGLHVGTTSKAARDRFVALNTSSPVRSLYKKGMPFEEALVKGRDYPQAGPPMNPLLKSMVGKETKSSYGSSMPLKANVNKPFLNPKTGDPFSETELFRYLEDKAAKTGTNNTEAAISLRKELANQDYTHIPYVNDFEDKNTLSLIMLIDRPKGSAAVLKGKFGKNDPKERTNPDIMKEDGGVISLKDKAVNMNRGPQGIEPYVQYMEPGGVVQSIKDYVGSFFEEEPIVPERNIFEEQRVVEQNSPFPKEEVEPVQETAPVQTKKEALMDLADREAGLELINRVGFDPLAYKMMQAGLRDNRSLSDFLKIYPTVTDDMTVKQKDTALTEQLRGLGLAGGKYFPLDNMVVVEPMKQASAYFQSPTDMIIMHEILHKGAETLTKDPNVDLKSLREKLDTGDYENIGDDTEGGRAEHRYIQAIVNKAYIDNMLNQVSVYANRGLVEAQKILDNPKSSFAAKVSAEFDLKNIPKYIDRDKKEALINEIRRSTNMYMEEEGKVEFKKMIEDLHPNKDLFNRDKEDVEDNFTVKELRQVYDLLNIKMLFEPSTIKFISEMSKSAPSGQLMDKKSYSDLFPEQFGDPNRPYEKTYTNITPDMSYFDVMSARDKFIRGSRKENKAEGGVIGLKDRAVKMYRNVV